MPGGGTELAGDKDFDAHPCQGTDRAERSKAAILLAKRPDGHLLRVDRKKAIG
jgi:hypothetical protein